MHGKEFSVVETSRTDRSPAMMIMRCPDVMRVHVEDILSTYRQSATSLVLLADSFREEPIQNTMINVSRSIPGTEVPKFAGAESVPESVKLQ
ncbi:MAG: hypothetical protein OEZ48_13715, partial [Candidatus Bathyarchaeota archaeon]|nr:hypothetical protein [Candidatus Bathyarchaeota archaeon]